MAKVSKTLNSLGDHLRTSATVRNVYGEPVKAGGRIVVPAARISYGFGAGGSEAGETESGSSGGGGGMRARPAGALEITETGTRFIPFIDPPRLAAALVLGVLIGLAIGRGSSRRPSAPAQHRETAKPSNGARIAAVAARPLSA